MASVTATAGPGTGERDGWDLVVIGGGTAGLLGAKTAARLGARVLLVEAHRTGGDCLWTGCVPSKALLAAAHTAAEVRRAARFGVNAGEVSVDFAAVRDHIAGAIASIAPTDSVEALEAAGVTVMTGEAAFAGPTTIRVDDGIVTFRRALIATGATPIAPADLTPVTPGLAEAEYVTSDTVWDVTELPRKLVVLGGGSIGCELGQAFARLGSAVTIVEQADRLLPEEDPMAAALVVDALRADDIAVRLGTRVAHVERDRLSLTGGESVEYDRLLMAVGRTPRTSSLNLHAAGIDLTDLSTGGGFINVDQRLRTSNPRVWAAGDVTGHPQFTHVAGVHGALAASNAVLGVRRAVDLSAIPRVTFTQPEVAAVGLPTDQVPRGHRLLEWDHAHLDRAITDGNGAGCTRLIVDGRGRIKGATVVGPRAGESLGELALAVSRKLRTGDLAATMHPYPTYNDAAWSAAIDDYVARLAAPVSRTAFGALLRLRRAAAR
jgi:pyruvate/2-oxoglutarate dehydrogenase complex dihydrolipoamide dehydrogenase (E3) component